MNQILRNARWTRARDERRVDIAFYVPFIGSLLSVRRSLPPGGAETQILLLAKTLVRHGVSVAIIAYGHRSELPQSVDGVRVVVRPPHTRRLLIGKLIEAGHIWGSLWRCPSRTVVYRCAGPPLGLVAIYTKLARRKLLFSAANVVDFQYVMLARNKRDLRLYELGVRLSDGIVAQTEEQIDLCEAAFGRRPTVIKSLSSLAQAPSGTTPEAFLWVGRLVTYKRPMEYVELARRVPEAQFWMVAVPNEEDNHSVSVDVLAAEAAEIPNLKLLPPRPHQALCELIGRAVASVNTADFEGMPNVLLEAWSRGVPALALTHDPGGVIREHGLGAFAGGSADVFAALASELWAGRHDRAALSSRCLSYVVANHSPDAVAEQWKAAHLEFRPAESAASTSQSLGFQCAE